MAYKTTKKQVKMTHDYVIGCGADEMQNLLRYKTREAYTSGVYGWNADIYTIYNEKYGRIAIVTGYRGFGVRNHEVVKKHEEAVKKYMKKYSVWTDGEKIKKYAEKRLNRCIEEIVQEV